MGEGHQLRGEGIEGARPEATALPFPQPACPPPRPLLPRSSPRGSACLIPAIIVGPISTTSLVEVEF